MSDATTRAAHAKQLLEDALLTELFDEVEKAAIEAWASTAMGDHENREIAYQALKAVRRVRAALQGVVDNGLIEARRVARPSA